MNKEDHYDFIIIGGGIIGLSFAYHLLNKQYKVLLLEKDNYPNEASVRNFGQVVPSGFGAVFQHFGRISTDIYLDLKTKANLPVEQEGSIYLASDEYETTLIEELHDINKDNDYTSFLLTKEECMDKYPDINPDYVKAGLFFPDEIKLDPALTNRRLLDYLCLDNNLIYHSTIFVKDIYRAGNTTYVITACKKMFTSAKVLLCNGANFEALYPSLFLESDLTLVKLQMMEVENYRKIKIHGSILTGWSIRRYESFKECKSYNIDNIDQELYYYKNGVHILFKQNDNGNLIIGDSHHYANINERTKLGYDIDNTLNNFILDEAAKIFNLTNPEMLRTWTGIYSQCKTQDYYYKNVDETVHIITGIGGKGMTASFGFADYIINKYSIT